MYVYCPVAISMALFFEKLAQTVQAENELSQLRSAENEQSKARDLQEEFRTAFINIGQPYLSETWDCGEFNKLTVCPELRFFRSTYVREL